MPDTETKLITVEEFARIPDPPGGCYELHHGELVLVPPPVFKHYKTQRDFMHILERICTGWFVGTELPFRPLPAIPETGWLDGAPDLVIEILSPSNTAQEMIDREHIWPQGGCREFWVVDLRRRIIRVSTHDGHPRTSSKADEIPLDRFVPAKLSVAEVFAE